MNEAGTRKYLYNRNEGLHAYPDAPNIIDMATAYAPGIVRNHPFIDGNNRTGFVVSTLFLELNGYRFTAARRMQPKRS